MFSKIRKDIATSGKTAMKGDKWAKKNWLLERTRRRKGINSQDRNEVLLGSRRKWSGINGEMVKYEEVEKTEGGKVNEEGWKVNRPWQRIKRHLT